MQKRLYRSPKDGILLGIGSGLAHYFNTEPVFVRLAMVLIALFVHLWPALVLYAILFFVVPVDPAQAQVARTQEPADVTPEEKMDSGQNM